MKKLLSLWIIGICVFTSSLLVHASSMDFLPVDTDSSQDNAHVSHDFSSQEHDCCDEDTQSQDCIEHCIGEYDHSIVSVFSLPSKSEIFLGNDYVFSCDVEVHQEPIDIRYATGPPPCYDITPYPDYVGITVMTI